MGSKKISSLGGPTLKKPVQTRLVSYRKYFLFSENRKSRFSEKLSKKTQLFQDKNKMVPNFQGQEFSRFFPGNFSTLENLFSLVWWDSIAQMVERRRVEPEAPGSNPAAGEFFCNMLQHVTSDREYIIPTKWTYDRISVYMARYCRW